MLAHLQLDVQADDFWEQLLPDHRSSQALLRYMVRKILYHSDLRRVELLCREASFDQEQAESSTCISSTSSSSSSEKSESQIALEAFLNDLKLQVLNYFFFPTHQIF
jgi:hypothetical protein